MGTVNIHLLVVQRLSERLSDKAVGPARQSQLLMDRSLLIQVRLQADQETLGMVLVMACHISMLDRLEALWLDLGRNGRQELEHKTAYLIRGIGR